jgi:hypothetical protein
MVHHPLTSLYLTPPVPTKDNTTISPKKKKDNKKKKAKKPQELPFPFEIQYFKAVAQSKTDTRSPITDHGKLI